MDDTSLSSELIETEDVNASHISTILQVTCGCKKKAILTL